MLGWIYVLSNEAMPGLVKIGQSGNDPEYRAMELHTTGVPSKFVVEYKGLYDNFSILERSVHAQLSEHRHDGNREFFRMSVIDAVSAIRGLSICVAKYEELNFQDYSSVSAQGYCRNCGIVISVTTPQCTRCGEHDPAR